MKPLESRKRLLIAESELNRTELLYEGRQLADGVNALIRQARTLSFLASAAVSLVSSFATVTRKRTAPAAEKPSWWRTFFKSAGLVGSLWSEFRARGNGPKES